METKDIIGHKQQLWKLNLLLTRGEIPQSLLFSGIPGIGKKMIARDFLSALFCIGEKPPCHECHPCITIGNGTSPDMIELLPDEKDKIPIGNPEKKENGSVRWLIDRLTKKAVSGTYGVIIDGVDKISIEGQNALLKTIEEPTAGTHMILISSNKSRILPTIISRCTEIAFHPLSSDAVQKILEESGIPGSEAKIIAELSGGSMETARRLANKEVFESLIGLAGAISAQVSGIKGFIFDLNPLHKQMNNETIINILVNIFRYVCIDLIKGHGTINAMAPVLHDIVIDEPETIAKIIKILLGLRKGLSQNLNFKQALKGSLYSMQNKDMETLPFLN